VPVRAAVLTTVAGFALFMFVVPASPGLHAGGRERPQFKAVAFDYFVLFNPDSVIPEAERLFPGKGRELTTLWRTRQFEYSWLRSITGRYNDFFAVTEDALVYAANSLKLELTAANRRRLLDAYLHLAPWPDAADGLRQLKASGIRVITIANFSPMMLESNARNAGFIPLFDALLSTDANRSFKPEPRVTSAWSGCT
jgi:2-haloacid dehalogenase